MMEVSQELLTSTAGVVRWIRWSPDGSVTSVYTAQSTEPYKCSLGSRQFGKEPATAVAGLERSVVGVLRQLDVRMGNYFVFQSTRNWSSQIFAIREKSELFRKRDPLPVQLTSGPVSYRGPVPSRDGRRILVVATSSAASFCGTTRAQISLSPFLAGFRQNRLTSRETESGWRLWGIPTGRCGDAGLMERSDSG